jgi:indolepyruvate ferredoxin oxidoreductase alpha subunit
MHITKNVGMSWIMDPLIDSVHHETEGALVIVIGDDPGGNTTSVEMDSRFLGMAAEIPILEGTTSQELKEITKAAFALSRKIKSTVMVRLTRAQAYGRGVVALGPIDHANREKPPHFENDPHMWGVYVGPEFTRNNLQNLRHRRFHRETVPLVREEVENFPFNEMKLSGQEKLGIIASGISYLAAEEAMETLGVKDKVALLKLATVHPLPRKLVERFLSNLETVLVVEEVEPFIELQVRDIAADMEKHAQVIGKKSGHMPIGDCIDREKVLEPLCQLLGVEYEPSLSPERDEVFERVILGEIVQRPQGYFCPGCPELVGIAVARRVAKKLYKDDFISHGDIGCYEHAHQPPLDFEVSVLCMGGGPGMATGNYYSGVGKKIICNLGDSTFFHAGIPPLINCVYNKTDVTFLIYDNRVVASTGHQPHPGGFGITATDEPTKTLDIADIARACQVDYVGVVDPLDIEQSAKVVEEAYKTPGVSMVVFRRTCAVVVERQLGGRVKMERPLYQINPERCTYIQKGKCLFCVNDLGCAALMREDRNLYIDPVTCFGCGACAEFCPVNAIEEVPR